MKYNIVLDIDQVMAIGNVKDEAQANFFHEKGVILTALKTHYIYPGAIDLIRLLCLNPDVKLSFFSAGLKQRNNILVDKILERALPEPEYERLRKEVRVLSREDMAKEMVKDRIFDYYHGDSAPSTRQKDLKSVLQEGDLLENAVLIDDQSQNAALDQLHNLLLVPTVEAEDYAELSKKREHYDSSGTRPLKCMVNIMGNLEFEKDWVSSGQRIFVYKNEEGFAIRFCGLDGMVYSEQVEDPEFCEQLDYFYKKGQEANNGFCQIVEPQVVKNICEFVKANHGKSTKICRKANQICYVTGLLFSAMARAEENGVSLSQALREHQFKENEPFFHRLKKDDAYYLLGLQKLQEVNEDFELITPHNYHASCYRSVSDRVRHFLQISIQNQFK